MFFFDSLDFLDIVLLIFFSLFCFAAFGVVMSRNTVHSVLYLVLVFLLSSLVFLFLGAEFLSILILIVYVGAICILFLFVVMLLNLRLDELYSSFLDYFPIGCFMGFFFFFELFYIFFYDMPFYGVSFYLDRSVFGEFFDWQPLLNSNSNLELFGFMLYNHCGLFVIVISVILLLAMVGIILITATLVVKSEKQSSGVVFLGGPQLSNISFWGTHRTKSKVYDGRNIEKLRKKLPYFRSDRVPRVARGPVYRISGIRSKTGRCNPEYWSKLRRKEIIRKQLEYREWQKKGLEEWGRKLKLKKRI